MRLQAETRNTSQFVRILVAGACVFMSVAMSGCNTIYREFGGAFEGGPHELDAALSDDATKLVKEAFEGLDDQIIADYHVHVIGDHINENWLSWSHPLKRIRTAVYLTASGVELNETYVEDYANRLVDLIRNSPRRGRYHIYAMDKHYRPDGTVNEAMTPFYVSNDYVIDLAKQHPDIFVPVISVHPNRDDAVAELTHLAEQGHRFVKWLPNAMGIDPSDSRHEAFYRVMKQFDMVLLSHTGMEQAVDAHGSQNLGNPLLLRTPLSFSVKVVALHVASTGTDIDLDDERRPTVSSFDLFMRMMDTPQYDGLLFGEISATTFFNHLHQPLRVLLERQDLHHRLLNGSDYPLPGINFLLRTSSLVDGGFITREQRKHLNEIYKYNPLLFDFVIKRTIRHPQTGQPFKPDLFTATP